MSSSDQDYTTGVLGSPGWNASNQGQGVNYSWSSSQGAAQINLAGKPQSLQAGTGLNLTGLGSKKNIKYVIVTNNGGPCLELDEQQKITPREMIGICKFINTVQMVATGLAAGFDIEFEWIELIENLGIRHHFTAGLSDYTQYSLSDENLYVFLFENPF